MHRRAAILPAVIVVSARKRAASTTFAASPLALASSPAPVHPHRFNVDLETLGASITIEEANANVNAATFGARPVRRSAALREPLAFRHRCVSALPAGPACGRLEAFGAG